MSQLVIKSTERKALFPLLDRSSDHLWGDVIDIIPDDFPTDHLVPEPFMVIKVDTNRIELEYLLLPLVAQNAPETRDERHKLLFRKRYSLVIEELSHQKFSELCATGKTVLTMPALESIIESREA